MSDSLAVLADKMFLSLTKAKNRPLVHTAIMAPLRSSFSVFLPSVWQVGLLIVFILNKLCFELVCRGFESRSRELIFAQV
jgi:hypothetical protein